MQEEEEDVDKDTQTPIIPEVHDALSAALHAQSPPGSGVSGSSTIAPSVSETLSPTEVNSPHRLSRKEPGDLFRTVVMAKVKEDEFEKERDAMINKSVPTTPR